MGRISNSPVDCLPDEWGCRPSGWGVNSTARMSKAAVSIARCTVHREPAGATGSSTAALNAMPAGLPLTVPREPGPRAVHQQVQRPACTATGDLHLRGLLPAAQHRVVRNGPVQPRQPRRACDHPGGLPGHHYRSELPSLRHRFEQRWRRRSNGNQLEQHLDQQAELDRRIGEARRAPARPAYGARQAISLYSQTRSDPHFLSAAL